LKPLGLYIHWPFCKAKCPYCDFNTHVHDVIEYDRWLAAYLRAFETYAAKTQDRILHSVFFGGGTPSLMPAEMVEALIAAIRKHWRCMNDLEITLEANPTSVEAAKFEAFAAAGVNRVSMGIQALNDKDLKFLGREHSAAEAMETIRIAQNCFDRFSFDLIYARPEQSLDDWSRELSQALEFKTKHLSLYQLTIEQGTAFHKSYNQGAFTMPSQELAADFYNLTQDILEDSGLQAYEVSNHAAREGDQCRHNLIYWHYDDYIGIGPGAHGRLTLKSQKYATKDHAAPESWLARVEDKGHGAAPYQALSADDQVLERFIMGLRLNAGMAIQANDWAYLDRGKLQTLVDQDWVVFDETHIRLKREGMLRLNAIIPFVFDDKAG